MSTPRFMFAVLTAFGSVACDGQSECVGCNSELEVVVPMTSVISAIEPRPENLDDCGSLQPPVSARARFRIGATVDGVATIVEESGGCVLEVPADARRYFGRGIDCVLPEDSALRMLGVTERRYESFLLDLETGQHAAHLRSLYGPAFTCAVSEGHVLEKLDAEPLGMFEGSFALGAEHPDGTVECGDFAESAQWNIEAIVKLPSDGTRALGFYGWGCSVGLDEGGPGVWSASGRACEFDRLVSVNDIGVTDISFDHLALNTNDRTLTAQGSVTRASPAGALTLCFWFESTLTD